MERTRPRICLNSSFPTIQSSGIEYVSNTTPMHDTIDNNNHQSPSHRKFITGHGENGTENQTHHTSYTYSNYTSPSNLQTPPPEHRPHPHCRPDSNNSSQNAELRTCSGSVRSGASPDLHSAIDTMSMRGRSVSAGRRYERVYREERVRGRGG
jgi:hypothetical protein